MTFAEIISLLTLLSLGALLMRLSIVSTRRHGQIVRLQCDLSAQAARSLRLHRSVSGMATRSKSKEFGYPVSPSDEELVEWYDKAIDEARDTIRVEDRIEGSQ